MSTKAVASVSYNTLETVSFTQDGASGTYSLGTRETLTPSTSPKAQYTINFSGKALSAGAYTLDLTAGPDGGSLSSYYLRSITVENPVANAASITLDVGASNGINFGGAAGDNITIPSGGSLSLRHGAAGTVVDATHKTIDITSSNATAVFNVCVVAGSN